MADVEGWESGLIDVDDIVSGVAGGVGDARFRLLRNAAGMGGGGTDNADGDNSDETEECAADAS